MRSDRIWTIIGIGAVVLFVGSIFWSIWFDTLLPLIRAGDTPELIANLVGIPIILAGTVLFCYGGFVFVRDTFAIWSGFAAMPEADVRALKALPIAEQRRRYRALLWKAWQRPLLWMAIGFGLIAVGGFVINQVWR
jgi:hypothetical protein